MIRVFNGDALAFQEDEYDWRTALHYFLDGHQNDYVLIYRGEKPIKTLSYHDVCYNRDVPERILYQDQDIFAEARKYFFSYEKQEDRWKRAIAVCNRQDEVQCILYYQHNPIRTDFPVSEFEEFSYEETLDFELLSRADIYIIEEYDEYTAFIYDVLQRKFPEKQAYFLDENAQIFLEPDNITDTSSGTGTLLNYDNIVRITSKRERNPLYQKPETGIYSSLEIMTSLFWKREEHSYGELHPDKKFLLIHFPLYSSGLCDMIRFCMAKVAATEYTKTEYIPVIDLSVPDDPNQFSGGRPENVWEDFFEPLNEYDAKEVWQSQHVLLCKHKIDAFNPYIMEQLYNTQNMRAVCKKYLKPNREMASYINQIKAQLEPFHAKDNCERILGVVARGTDFKYGGFDSPRPAEDHAYIELVKEKMREWNCTAIFLATEDADILERFRQTDFDGQLYFIDQNRYRYPNPNQPGILVAKLKKDTQDYRNEMPYLAVLYLLSECVSLISNCRCGAFIVADYINGGMYEHRYCCGEGECE